jgi:hypothetical protein
VAFALGVLGLLIYKLAVGLNWLVVLVQVVLILCVVVTSALDSATFAVSAVRLGPDGLLS